MRPVVTSIIRSVVCMSVCVHVFGTRVSCAKTAKTMEVRFEGYHVGARNHILDGRTFIPTATARGAFEGYVCRPIVTYLRMANMPAQRSCRTNAFAAAKSKNTAMRPIAKLLHLFVWDNWSEPFTFWYGILLHLLLWVLCVAFVRVLLYFYVMGNLLRLTRIKICIPAEKIY